MKDLPDLDLLHELTEAHVADMLFDKIYERAYDYYCDRRVQNPRRSGALLEAEVQGAELYHVRIKIHEGLLLASCTCPFAETAVCKHIGAVLLQWVHEPESFAVLEEEEPPASAADLDRESTESGLPALLERLSLSELREIARQRGWSVKGSNKAEYCTALALLLADPTEIARAVTALPDSLREALHAAFVAEEGSGIFPTILAQVMTALRGTREPALKPVEAVALLTDLSRLGLLIPWRDSPDSLLRYLFPWEVQRHVPPLPGWCPQVQPATTVQKRSRSRRDVLKTMYAIWEHIRQQPPALRPQPEPLPEKHRLTALEGWAYEPQELETWLAKKRSRTGEMLHKLPVATPTFLLDDTALSALSPLTGGNGEELEFMCQLLCELDLVSLEQGYLLARPEAMTHFLRHSNIRQQALVAQAYLSMQNWSELYLLLRTDQRLAIWRKVFATFTYDQFCQQLLRLRHLLLRFLATAGEEGWCLLSDVVSSLRILWPQLATILEAYHRPRLTNLWGLDWRQDRRELSPENEQDWRAAQGGFLRALLEGPLYWLGFAELGYEDGQLVAFRLHGLANWMWDRLIAAPEELPTGEPVMIDEANRTITVYLGAVPPQVHTLLGRIARLEQTSPACFVYRLDMRTTHATFERGESLQDLLAAWAKTIPVPIPASLRNVLAEWWAQYGQVRLYEGFALLELGDDIALLELEASTPLRQHIVARLSPRLVLVAEEAVDELLQAFTAKEHTPKEVK